MRLDRNVTTVDRTTPHRTTPRLLRLAVAVGILWMGWLILTPYPHYLPPDLSRGFLKNKADYFFRSGYFLGFYAHITSAPVALLCGAIQMSRTVRRRWPLWHRRIGKLYSLLVLVLVAPGGLVMGFRAYGGTSSIVSFVLISSLAWWFTGLGWRAANRHRFAEHGRWMARSYAMICSAVTLRLIHYLMQPLNLDHTLTYQVAVWMSWVPVLILLEWVFRVQQRRVVSH